MHIVLRRAPEGAVATLLSDDGQQRTEPVSELAPFVAQHEAARPRWVWDDTSAWYPLLLAAGVRVERCFDLRLCHAILRGAVLTAGSALATAPEGPWDVAAEHRTAPDDALFDLEETAAAIPDALAEFELQRAAVAGSPEPGRIDRLLAAESAGALIAVELRHAGLPWRAEEHDRLLTQLLGPRPEPGERPEVLRALAERIRELLGVPALNPDSQPELLAALQRAGLRVRSTSRWELRELDHPAVAPVLEYKKLARLLSANGWSWLDTWVVDGRFRPEYVPGGVVTGRWATSGGGALQLPRQLRGAVIADEGWKLVVADAAQLEPRILAAMSGDEGMLRAGAAGDLYQGIVASGAVRTREEAKLALLGAMYGATTGDSGRLLPRLERAYPKALALVAEAASTGQRGGVVCTQLGRTSPRPGTAWLRAQAAAAGEGASAAQTSKARAEARAWGRFTRNFVVQGTAAEWALCWMAGVRARLTAASGSADLLASPHLVFFLHDELVVHAPAALAERAAEAVQDAAADAGRLLFGASPARFPLSIAVVDRYSEAK